MRRRETTAQQPRRRRVILVVGVALVGVAGAWLALRGGSGGGEESSPAEGPAPEPPAAAPGFEATLTSYPLLVDDRLRVTGDEHGLAAHPIAAADGDEAHWTYSRSDDELLALRLAPEPAGRDPIVAALWDDGTLTGLDARTGEPAWRLGVADESAFMVEAFDPAEVLDRGLVKVVAADGGDVVVVQVESTLIGVDAADGAELWRHDASLCDSAPSPISTQRWWSVGGPGAGHIVIDATCEMPDAQLVVLDPRTGDVTHELASKPSWYSTAPNEEGAIVPVGCRPDLTECALTEHHPTGSTYGKVPVRWVLEAGQLAETPRAAVEGVEPRPNGDFELFSIDRATGEVAWTVTGQARDLARPQFVDAVATREDVWVASLSWNGGPPALVRLSAADGSLTGCLPSPGDGPVTQVRVPGAGYVVISSFPASRDTAFDPSEPDGSVRMIVPELQPDCPTG